MSDAASVLNGTANGVGLFLAPVGTTAPSDADTALNSAFEGVGYVKEDEVPNLSQEITTVDIGAWQSASAIKSRVTKRDLSLAFTLIEANPLTLGLFFSEAEPTPVLDEFTIALSSTPAVKEYAAVLQIKDDTAYIRFYLEKVTLSSTGTLSAGREEPLALPIVLKALDNGSGLGDVFVKNPGSAWDLTP